MTQDPIAALTDVGFGLNEARAYVALLEGGTQTGYEVGQRAQIPRSAVYGALRKLVEADAARSIAGTPERFVAVPPDTVLGILRKRFDARATGLEDALRNVGQKPTAPDVYSVRGYEPALEEASRLCRGATRSLLVSGWPREISRLAGELSRAEARGVHVVLFSHAALPPGTGGVQFSYGLEEQSLEAFWRHRLIVVADDRRTLIAAAEQTDDDRAVVSETPAIAEVATSQIALDITLLGQRTGRDVGPVMTRLLGDRVGDLDGLLRRQ